MRIVNRHIIDICVAKHASSKKALEKFTINLKNFEGNSHNELLAIFPNADYVGEDRYVFDIKGNRFRVVCVIVFFNGSASVRFAGTHAEYDKIDALII